MGVGDNATHMNGECIGNSYAAEMAEGTVLTLCVCNRSSLPRQTRTATNSEAKRKEDEGTTGGAKQLATEQTVKRYTHNLHVSTPHLVSHCAALGYSIDGGSYGEDQCSHHTIDHLISTRWQKHCAHRLPVLRRTVTNAHWPLLGSRAC